MLVWMQQAVVDHGLAFLARLGGDSSPEASTARLDIVDLLRTCRLIQHLSYLNANQMKGGEKRPAFANVMIL